MALQSAKALLDELMGRDRDFAPAEKNHDFSWDSSDVCKHYLVKFCPNDLFVNTKADLGPCGKIHDERLRKEYQKSSRFQRMGYEEDFLRFCQSMLSDVDKRIRRAKQRLALSSQEANLAAPTPQKNNEEKINVLSERISGLLAQVENLGCEGKVEEAQGIMKLCDQLKEEREVLKKAQEANHWLQTAEIAAAQEKQMEVCDVCGAFLIVGDAQQRVDDHLMGKQHVGYARLKEAVDEIVHGREKERQDREKLREKDREERRRLREEEDKKRDERRRKIEDERRREQEKQRDRERERRRSRSRDRKHSRSHRSRSRERNTSSKVKDKDRHHRSSRSQERRRSRSRSHDGHHSRKLSHSPEHKKDKDRRDRKDKSDRNRDHRRRSSENGEVSDYKHYKSEEYSHSKGYHSAGDSDS